VIRGPEAHGSRAQRQRGSHRVYRHPDHPDRRVVIAGNEGTDVPTGTLAAIHSQAGIDPPPGRDRPTGSAMGGSDALQRRLRTGRHELGRVRPRPSRVCAVGADRAEVEALIVEAIGAYLDDLRDSGSGHPVPPPRSATGLVDVA
jgi:predicted RNA binding protein YcfA (HicA-like mRNA interferase family)